MPGTLSFSVLEGYYEQDPDGVCLGVARTAACERSGGAQSPGAARSEIAATAGSTGSAGDGPAAGDASVVGDAGDAKAAGDAPFEDVTYACLCEDSLRLSRALRRKGVGRGSCCVADTGNCALLACLLTASAFGGFSVFLTNPQLDERERQRRIRCACDAMLLQDLPVFDEASLARMIAEDAGFDFVEPFDALACLRRAVDGFDPSLEAVVLAAPDGAKQLKIIPLTWENLLASASAWSDAQGWAPRRLANAPAAGKAMGPCQVVRPLCFADALQSFVASLLTGRRAILYRRFDAQRVLCDARTQDADCIVVDRAMLDALLRADSSSREGGLSPEGGPDRAAGALAGYRCIQVDDPTPGPDDRRRFTEAAAHVSAALCLPEAAGCIACRPVDDALGGMLGTLSACDLVAIAPDSQGFGQLGIKGPAVMHGYLNARAAFTADRFLLTGMRVRVRDGYVQAPGRNGDAFVSGGETMHPDLIRSKLLQLPDVADACVFADEDEELGACPVAVVEATADAVEGDGAAPVRLAGQLREGLEEMLSPAQCPRRIMAVPRFPRGEDGTFDEDQVRTLYRLRIDVRKVEMWAVDLPLASRSRAKASKQRQRCVLLVRLTDWAGRTGIGEADPPAGRDEGCGAESLAADRKAIVETLGPAVLGSVLVHPGQADALFAAQADAAALPMARSAVEGALWDLYGKIRRLSLRALIGARECATESGSLHEVPAGCVPGAALVDAGGKREVVERVRSAVQAGCSSVTISVRPGCDVAPVGAVRREFPELAIVVDAGRAYTEEDADALKKLDDLGPVCIEDPLDPARPPKVGPQKHVDRLARLQRDLHSPVCVRGGRCSAGELRETLESHPDLRCVCITLGEMGGVQPALDFYRWARARGVSVRLGSTGGSGVACRAHAAFAMLPGMNIPGSICSTASYLERDICQPPFELQDGLVQVNPPGCEYGLGCMLDMQAVTDLCRWSCVLD